MNKKRSITSDLKRLAAAKVEELAAEPSENSTELEEVADEEPKNQAFLKEVFSREMNVGGVKLAFWKWLLVLFVLGCLFLGFYLLGVQLSKKNIVLAYEAGPQITTASTAGLKDGPHILGRAPAVPAELSEYARGIIVVDWVTGSVLMQQAEDTQHPIASLTKLVTAQVAMEQWAPNDVLEITVEIDPEVESSAGLIMGEKYTVKDLTTALLVSSAAEAGYTFADSYPGGREAFIARMNAWVAEQGLIKTVLVDPVGMSEENVSTASEIAHIARVVLQNDLISTAVGTTEAELCAVSATAGAEMCVTIQNTNELLFGSEEFVGVKTGYTVKAGPCLVVWYQADGEDLLVVMLNANDRFELAGELVAKVSQYGYN